MTVRPSCVRPASLDETVELLAAAEGLADVIAGGSDLMVQARDGRRPLRPKLVSLDRLDELRVIHAEVDRYRIGALATHATIESSLVIRDRLAAFADASALVGSPATRHVGTLGGNICNASPAMDLGSPLLVHEAIVELRSVRGSRFVDIGDLLVLPGRTARSDDEVVTSVHVPSSPDRTASAYVRLGYRRAMEIAVVGAAALLTLQPDGRCRTARIALTAVGETCSRVHDAERLLEGRAITPAAIESAASASQDASAPIDDVRGSAAYRRAMVPVIVRRALEQAALRARAKEGNQ